MSKSLLDLAKELDAMPTKIGRAANQVKIDTVKAIDRDLVPHTPVDVTTAVSNWQPGVGVAPSFELPAIVPGEAGSTAAQSREEAIAHVDRALADVQPGQPFFLSNLTDYIEGLNNGTSAQEPAGFVERAVLIGHRFVRRAKLVLK